MPFQRVDKASRCGRMSSIRLTSPAISASSAFMAYCTRSKRPAPHIGNACSLTIVGDIHQVTNPFINIGNYAILKKQFSGRVSHMELTRSYRSSLEITDFAGRILSENPQVESVRSTGNKPKLVPVGSSSELSKTIVALLKMLSISGYNSIAVICKRVGIAKRCTTHSTVLFPLHF